MNIYLIEKFKTFELPSAFIIVVYSVSLREQLQDMGKKLVGDHNYNKDGSVNGRQEFFAIASSNCHCLFHFASCSYIIDYYDVLEHVLEISSDANYIQWWMIKLYQYSWHNFACINQIAYQ